MGHCITNRGSLSDVQIRNWIYQLIITCYGIFFYLSATCMWDMAWYSIGARTCETHFHLNLFHRFPIHLLDVDETFLDWIDDGILTGFSRMNLVFPWHGATNTIDTSKRSANRKIAIISIDANMWVQRKNCQAIYALFVPHKSCRVSKLLLIECFQNQTFPSPFSIVQFNLFRSKSKMCAREGESERVCVNDKRLISNRLAKKKTWKLLLLRLPCSSWLS